MSMYIKEISICYQKSVKDALNKMDETGKRLLIVVDENENYLSLVSIGDVQRNLIKHQNFNTPIKDVLRKKVVVANVKDSKSYIKDIMLKGRVEFMPILDNDNSLVDIVYWGDLFEEEHKLQTEKLNLPVVIMAGGEGRRLRPLTYIIPKPLVPIGDKPIIQRIVNHFVNAGCNEFLFSVSYKASMIKNYFDDIKDKKYDVSYFKEDKPMGTAGSLSLIKHKINKTFFISNCDIIIKQDYAEIYNFHKKNNNELTAVAFVKDLKIPYGTFEVGKNGVLKSLVEKPEFTFLVNAGLYILEPHLLNEIPENEFFHITHLMEQIIARKGKVGVFPITEGSWQDIGQWDEYQKTLNNYNQ